MVVRAALTMALDFAKSKAVEPATVTWRDGEQWWIRQVGPTYDNTLKVTHFDAEGLKWLENRENTAKTAVFTALRKLTDAQDTKGESAGSAGAGPTQ